MAMRFIIRKFAVVMLPAIAAAAPWACSSVSPDGETWVASEGDGVLEEEESDAPVGTLRQPLTGTHKICTARSPGLFRDSLVVPNGWTASDCDAFAESLGASNFFLGCISDDGPLGFGSENGGVPALNLCGW